MRERSIRTSSAAVPPLDVFACEIAWGRNGQMTREAMAVEAHSLREAAEAALFRLPPERRRKARLLRCWRWEEPLPLGEELRWDRPAMAARQPVLA